ncbi:uncharacterized protein LOC134196850 [Corticium candelabrum]|uniref:uncharacterized protein LOC134196850 n=1 Tax=Corticium candelabrum TaxID=121492 RepID=UPI002E270459|nr:uncharacterized protein LOC134196850 [Corticium candelabrum]
MAERRPENFADTRHRLRAAVVCTAGFLVHLTLGTLYSYGNMAPYIVSYIRKYGTPQSLTVTTASWIYALMLAGQGSSMWIGGIIEKKLGARLTTLVGCMIMSAGVTLTYFSISSFWLTLLTYGLLFGVGVGIAYAPPMACAMRWLPRRKGLAAGIIVSGFGAGAFVFDQVQTAFINPHNVRATTNLPESTEKYFDDEDVLHRTRLCFLLLGGIYFIIQIVGCLFLFDPKEEHRPSSYSTALDESDSESVTERTVFNGGDEDSVEYEENSTEAIDQQMGLRPRQLFQQVSFYVLWFMFLCNGLAVVFISTLFKAFGLTFINNDHFLADAGAVAAPFNAVSRIFWGYMADRFSFRIAMISMTCLMTALLLSFEGTTLVGKPMFFIWVCLLFFCIGGNFSLFPAATARFGKSYFTTNYGLVFTSQVVAGPIGALLSTTLSGAIGWTGIWFLAASLSFLGTTFAFFYKMPTTFISKCPGHWKCTTYHGLDVKLNSTYLDVGPAELSVMEDYTVFYRKCATRAQSSAYHNSRNFVIDVLVQVFLWCIEVTMERRGENTRHTIRATVVCIAGFLVHLTLGTLYSFGNMAPYIVSYIREYGTPHSLTVATSTWIFALTVGGHGASMWIGGIIEKKLGARLTTFVGCIIMSTAVTLTYFSLSSFWLTLLTYGLLFGIGIGFAYGPPVACAMRWLPDRKGLASGIVVAGFGAGAFIFDQVQTAYINPHNVRATANPEDPTEKYFDNKDVLHRTRESFLLLGGIYFVIQIIGCIFLSDPKEELKPSPYSTSLDKCDPESVTECTMLNKRDKDLAKDDENSRQAINQQPGFHPRQLFHQVSFYILWFMFLCNGQTVVLLSSLFKAFGLTFINNDHFLAIVGAVSAPFNAVSRIFWGYIADRFSFRIAMISMTSLMTALLLSFEGTTRGGKPMFFIWVCLLFFCAGGNYSLFPAATARFGKLYFTANYGLVFTSQAVAGPISALLSTTLSRAIGWTGIWFMTASLSFLGTALAFFYKMPSIPDSS